MPSETTGDVSTADLSTALEVSASTNSEPIWKHMGEPLADVMLANALVTCYLTYVTTTRAVSGLFLACPHLCPPDFTNYFPSRRGVLRGANDSAEKSLGAWSVLLPGVT